MSTSATPWANYAAPADGPWAKYGSAPPASAPNQPEQPGFLKSLGQSFGIDPDAMKERAKPTLRNLVEDMPGVAPLEGAYHGFMRSTGELGKGVDAAMEGNPSGLLSHGISAIPFAGPAIDKAGEQAPAPTPGESYLGRIGDVATNPGAMGTILGGAAQLAPLVMGSGVSEGVADVTSDLNQKFNPLPLRSRAVNTLEDIRSQAANVPVSMTETDPAIQKFRQSVATGGRNASVMTKLGRRVDAIPTQGDVLFPEARDFYTNVSRESARPGILRRMIEKPSAPDLRRNLGDVREAMSTDLTKAADTIGRGEDYTGAMKEYANNAKLRKLGLIGAGIAGAEVAKRAGLLGTLATKVAGQ